jgi:hypothetical protein
MYRNVKVFVTILGCCIGYHASATDIFRCTTSSGAVEYRGSPCAPGSGGKVAIQDDTPSAADQVAANNAIREMREQSKAIDARMNARARAARLAREAEDREQARAERIAEASASPEAPDVMYVPYAYPIAEPVRHHHHSEHRSANPTTQDRRHG